MRRLLTVVLAVSMLATVPLVPATGTPPPAAKLGENLQKLLAGDPAMVAKAGPDGLYTILALGPLHHLPSAVPADRAAWNQFWAEDSAAFVSQVAHALRPGERLTSIVLAGPLLTLRLPAGRVADLAALPTVRAMDLDFLGTTHVLDDPLGPAGPALAAPKGSGPGAQDNESLPLTGAPAVQALGFRGEGVKLAMIDTGVLPTHEEFRDEFGNSRVVGWVDATGPPGSAGTCATACDSYGHGTHTTTIAAGSTIAGGLYDGMAPRATIYAVRIFQGGSGQWSWAADGLNDAFNMGADVTSNSWGGGCGSDPTDQNAGYYVQIVAENLAVAGMQSVFAAGNNGPGSAGGLCPGRSDYVISVAAVDKNKVIAGFSSGGPCPASTYDLNMTRICPKLSAVGVDVNAGIPCSTFPCSAVGTCEDCYASLSGTSMATPHVAGGALLMYQIQRAANDGSFNVPNKDLENLFKQYAEDLGPSGPDNSYGWGFIHVDGMANQLLSTAQARVTATLSLAKPEMRNRDTNTATLTITNTGGKAVSGTARITADGEMSEGTDGKVYGSGSFSLQPGESTNLVATIPGTNLDPTTYHVLGAVSYTYTSDAGHTVNSQISAENTFILRGVKMTVARLQGTARNQVALPPTQPTGNQTIITVVLTNAGNEPATGLSLREGVPLLGYVLTPQANTKLATDPGSLLHDVTQQFTTPPADGIAADAGNGSLDLSFAPAPLQAHAQYKVVYNVRTVVPGQYTFEALVDYTDGAGDHYEKTLAQAQQVLCPPEPTLTPPKEVPPGTVPPLPSLPSPPC